MNNATRDEAGHDDLQAACDAIGYCETGEAVATPAFALPAEHIIHAVGPMWQGGAHDEAEKLASCYTQSLDLASRLGCTSIAFPLISSGIYGYPKEEAWEIALTTCRTWLEGQDGCDMEITFCVTSPESLDLGVRLLQG